MGRETNIHLIQALEKRIKEGKGDIIKLKRDRNSLLNISTRLPPEILGHIFARSLTLDAPCSSFYQDFVGLTLEFLGKHFAGLEEMPPPPLSHSPRTGAVREL